MIPDAVLAQIKHDNPCDAIAGRWVRLRKHGTKMVGPCPICSRDRQGKSASRFEATTDGWVCAVCADGGDIIGLVMKAEGLDFRDAIAWLGGPGEVSPAVIEQRERECAAERAKREAEADAYRQRERGTLYDIWRAAQPAPGTPVEDYLHRRRLDELPPGARLRCVPDMPYFHGEEIDEAGRKRQRVIHRGPAVVAPIVGPDGKFRGLHFTYLDLDQSNGKAVVTDPDTGELLPAKKVRGSKAGGYIELIRPASPARRLIIGEGIETVLSVWLALHKLKRDLSDVAFWSAVDLGNLGGRAVENIRHPRAVDARGRPRRVPGPVPDPESPAIALPDEIVDVVLLGDGDSDPVLTECALRRAAARWAGPLRQVHVAWAPTGRDFNDLLAE
jgi:CHC2 zinc finger